MLDYEIRYYKLEYLIKGAVCRMDHLFDTEEDAVQFIKENRENWEEYRLLKIQSAIIDF